MDTGKHVVEVRDEPRTIQLPRKYMRAAKREAKHAQYAKAGLNGKRARARRARQATTGHSDQRWGYPNFLTVVTPDWAKA